MAKQFRWFDTMNSTDQMKLGINHLLTIEKHTSEGRTVLFNPNLESLVYIFKSYPLRAKVVFWIESDEIHKERLMKRSKLKPDQPTIDDFEENDNYRRIAEKYHAPIISNISGTYDFESRLRCLDSHEAGYRLCDNEIVFEGRTVALYTVQLTKTSIYDLDINRLPSIFNIPVNKKVIRQNETIFDRAAMSWLLRNRYRGSVNLSVYTLNRKDNIPFYVTDPLSVSSIYWPIYDDKLYPVFSLSDNHSSLIKYIGRIVKTVDYLTKFRSRLSDLSRFFNFKIIDQSRYIININDETVHVSGHARYVLMLATMDLIDFTLWLNGIKFYLAKEKKIKCEIPFEWFNAYDTARLNGTLTENVDSVGFEHSINDIAYGLFSALIAFDGKRKFWKAYFLVMVIQESYRN